MVRSESASSEEPGWYISLFELPTHLDEVDEVLKVSERHKSIVRERQDLERREAFGTAQAQAFQSLVAQNQLWDAPSLAHLQQSS